MPTIAPITRLYPYGAPGKWYAPTVAASPYAAHDGSLASLTEAWIVQQIAALPAFTGATVEPFQGTTHPMGAEQVDELFANRPLYCCVLFEGDVPIVTQEGQQDYEPTYGIYVVVQNQRAGGSPRKGDGVTPGTNLMRDLLRNALHDREPALGVNGFWAERCEFRGVRVVTQRKDGFIIRAECVVREVPQAAT